jgi:hypothetical protein
MEEPKKYDYWELNNKNAKTRMRTLNEIALRGGMLVTRNSQSKSERGRRLMSIPDNNNDEGMLQSRVGKC